MFRRPATESVAQFSSCLDGIVKQAGMDDRPPTVAIDLDGTLASMYEKFDKAKIDPPRPGAKKTVDEFKKNGWRIIVFTVRGNKKLVADWLNEHEIPYDYINENPDQPDDASDKVIADLYICLLYTSPSPRDATLSRMPSSA